MVLLTTSPQMWMPATSYHRGTVSKDPATKLCQHSPGEGNIAFPSLIPQRLWQSDVFQKWRVAIEPWAYPHLGPYMESRSTEVFHRPKGNIVKGHEMLSLWHLAKAVFHIFHSSSGRTSWPDHHVVPITEKACFNDWSQSDCLWGIGWACAWC